MNATRMRTLDRTVVAHRAEFGRGPAGAAEMELLFSTARSGAVPAELLDDAVGTLRATVDGTARTLDEAAGLLEEVRSVTAGLPDLVREVVEPS